MTRALLHKTSLTTAVSCLLLPLAAHADTAGEIADLKARLAALEAKQEEAKPEMGAAILSDRIKFSGTLEVEAVYTDSDEFSGNSTSDLVLATAELDMEAAIVENVTGNLNLLYEDDGEEELDVDVATITFAKVAGIDVLLGQDYAPFGVFETHLVNDTLVLELAEIRETLAMATYGRDHFSVSAYTFNGDADNGDQIENYGLRLNVGNEQFSAGLDYLSNVADTDGIFDMLEEAGFVAGSDVDKTPDAWIVHGSAKWGGVSLIAEHFQADEFEAADWVLGFEPEASQLELSVAVGDWTLAAAYQETEDLAGLLPEERISVGASTDIAENVSLGMELWQDDDYSTADGGSGEEATSAVAQIAVSF